MNQYLIIVVMTSFLRGSYSFFFFGKYRGSYRLELVCNKRVRPMIEVLVCLYLNIFKLNAEEFIVK